MINRMIRATRKELAVISLIVATIAEIALLILYHLGFWSAQDLEYLVTTAAQAPGYAPQLVLSLVSSEDFIRVVIFPGVLNVLLMAAFLTWYERKLIAKVQIRIGPLYAGGARLGGILQAVADPLKLLFKEVIFPEKSDKALMAAVPIAMSVIAAIPFAVIPFGDGWVIADLDVGLPFVLAVLSLWPALVLLIAWASNSKFPFLGGLRALFQQTAYEIPLWMSVLGIVILSGSLNLTQIVRAQANIWFILPQALAFFVFLCCSLAELERIPFDLPEAEPELMMGWMTELSGALFMLAFAGAYIKMYLHAALTTVLFLGGWHGPEFLPGPVWFLIKTLIVITIFVIARGVFPRVRIDILLRLGWTRLLILSIVNIFIALLIAEVGPGELWRIAKWTQSSLR